MYDSRNGFKIKGEYKIAKYAKVQMHTVYIMPSKGGNEVFFLWRHPSYGIKWMVR